MLTRARMLDRFLASDAAFDGRFLTGVVTTGIYCLPSCRAKKPKAQNVRFFPAEDEARRAGLRPCRRCRPDLFYRAVDPDLDLAEGLLQRLRQAPGACAGTAFLGRLAGLGATALTELCRRHFHDTPKGLVLREQVAFARRELRQPGRRLLDVALDAGFASSSAFHDNFKARTGMTPRQWCELGRTDRFDVALPADLRSDDSLRAWGRDPDSLDERVSGRTLHKALHLDGQPAVLTVILTAAVARCQVQAARRPSPEGWVEAHDAVLALLGLPADPGPFERRALRTPGLRHLVAGRRGLRLVGTATVWDAAVWAIVGQQVNLPFAFRCRRALLERSGTPLGDLRAPPGPAAVAALDASELLARQFSRGKADYLLRLAAAVASGSCDLAALPHGSAVRAERTLLAQHGFGPWSAHYVLMRGCRLLDCLPVGDAGLVRALQECFALPERPDVAATRRLMAPFAPFRSLATCHLWRSLDAPAAADLDEGNP